MLKKLALISILMFFGCSAITEWRHRENFEEVAHAYKSALVWESPEALKDFFSKANGDKSGGIFDITRLKGIKITGYDELDRMEVDGELKVKQVVEIKYYNTKTLIEKTIIDRQTWVNEDGNWFLTTGLPEF